MVEDREVLAEVWAGRVPAIFSLALEDCKEMEANPPEPCCLLLPRMSYLPLATEKVRKHFSSYVTGPGEMWFSYLGSPMKWHHPIGLLYDLLTGAAQELSLPWQLTVHFSNFPADILLPCNSREAVESVFMSSLKESDQLKHGGRVVKQMQKKDHSQLWLGLTTDKFDQFWAINRRLMEPSGGDQCFKHVPVRLYLGGEDPGILQRLVTPGTNDQPYTIGQFQQDLGLEDYRLVIQGICPSGDTPLQWLAIHLAYPDNFLHVAVISTN